MRLYNSSHFEGGAMPKKENEYQGGLIKRIVERFTGSVVLKNDEQYCQGIPDLTVLGATGRWAVLEVKRSMDEPLRPNQEYYIEKFGSMGFAAIICPENEAEVLDEIQRALGY